MPSAPRHHLVILTDGEAALLSAHRQAAGSLPGPVISVEDCHAFIDALSALLVEAMTERMIQQSAIRARLTLVDRMVKLQETA